MAQKVHIVLEDDLDGTEATQTVTFGLDGTSYEIDLNEQNAGGLRRAMAMYVEHARKIGRKGRRGANAGSTGIAGASPKEIREWAKANKIDVPERGRIPQDLRDQYAASH